MSRLRLTSLVTLCFLASFVSCAAAPLPTYDSNITYSSSSAYQPGPSLLNPERGFHTDINLVNDQSFHWVRREGVTLARAYVRLDDYRDRDLPQDFLDRLNAGLSRLESAGIKIILRFTYNFPSDADTPAPDASLDQVLRHIGQLDATLKRHAGVISVVQAGFIGAWGEWHASANELTQDSAKAQILTALLAAVPENRSLQLRYPLDLLKTYPQPLAATDAFSTAAQARLGHHNDCFVSSVSDVGTYDPLERADELKTYLAMATTFVPVGGETCPFNNTDLRDDCATTLTELGRFHWDYLNQRAKVAADHWQAEGCLDEISARLGYRYRLLAGQVTPTVTAGESGVLRLSVSNEGFGKLYNQRPLELVLRNITTRQDVYIPLARDARTVLPLAGEERLLEFDFSVPDLEPGQYNLYLNLPDADKRLATNPTYSVQLANTGLFEASSGFNALQLTLTVD